jgi:hypothetical protein
MIPFSYEVIPCTKIVNTRSDPIDGTRVLSNCIFDSFQFDHSK